MRINEIRIPGYVLQKLQWKHHVSQEEIKQVLDGKPRLFFVETGETDGEHVYLALGKSQAGRYLSVFFIYKRSGSAIIISARDMAQKERRRYEKK